MPLIKSNIEELLLESFLSNLIPKFYNAQKPSNNIIGFTAKLMFSPHYTHFLLHVAIRYM